ncbi:hypothetical protein [Magnetococcus sp. PR-3]|uniref:hypothetical protein n=1 Tax=Magnetococcus sp. PR-3 TaxID=3120355 RepID=UPI002FCE1E8A
MSTAAVIEQDRFTEQKTEQASEQGLTLPRLFVVPKALTSPEPEEGMDLLKGILHKAAPGLTPIGIEELDDTVSLWLAATFGLHGGEQERRFWSTYHAFFTDAEQGVLYCHLGRLHLALQYEDEQLESVISGLQLILDRVEGGPEERFEWMCQAFAQALLDEDLECEEMFRFLGVLPEEA